MRQAPRLARGGREGGREDEEVKWEARPSLARAFITK